MIPRDRRGAAYGVYNAVFGIAWFAGSAIMGKLYDISIVGLIAFGMTAQLASAAMFVWLGNSRGWRTAIL
jgi:predicted MFS family arabinose efflux permease